MTPELNQYSDVSFWYQLNGHLWRREREYGDAWWLSAPTTPETVRFSQLRFTNEMRRRSENLKHYIERQVMYGYDQP